MDGLIDHFDYCEVILGHPFGLRTLLKNLVIMLLMLKLIGCFPARDSGLLIINRDADRLAMVSVVPNVKNLTLYVKHSGHYSGLDLDGICMIGSPSLPLVLSPMNHIHNVRPTQTFSVQRSPRTKSKAVKDNLFRNNSMEEKIGQRIKATKRVVVEEDNNDDDTNDNYGSDIIDSNNEVDKDDDDLFAEWVDYLYDPISGKIKKAKEPELKQFDYD